VSTFRIDNKPIALGSIGFYLRAWPTPAWAHNLRTGRPSQPITGGSHRPERDHRTMLLAGRANWLVRDRFRPQHAQRAPDRVPGPQHIDHFHREELLISAARRPGFGALGRQDPVRDRDLLLT
jgi:hypothetical protein